MSLHRVLGTAGHIDHGKTSLVRALTGIDTDRLKEEKARGITIELGFAHLALPSGAVIGVIDVPGHERFIRTMVAGAVGVDAALLVVAADEGVMQQTREHLDICGLLGIRAGVVALTKCDLVEPELRALAVEELREALRGTFLESAQVVACSAKTGEGLPELRLAIEAALSQTQESAPGRSPQGLLRLPVDRVFTLRGFGTVATGTLWSGTLRVGDELQPLPGTQVAKVRGLHVHGQAVTEAVAGQRTAVNLALPLSAIARGETLVPPGTLQAGTLLDVRLTLLGIARGPLARRSRLLLHLGTAQTLVLVTLLDRERLEPGESALAQLQLAQPLTALPGDRFVLRGFAPQKNHGTTIGGGLVLRVLPARHRRGSNALLQALTQTSGLQDELAAGRGLPKVARELVRLEAQRQGLGGVTLRWLRQVLPLPEVTLREALVAEQNAGHLIELVDTATVTGMAAAAAGQEEQQAVSCETLQLVAQALQQVVLAHHRSQPASVGLSKDALRSQLRPLGGTRVGVGEGPPQECGPRLLQAALAQQLHTGQLRLDKDLLAAATHRVVSDEKQQELTGQLAALFLQAGLAPPRPEELPALLSKKAVAPAAAKLKAALDGLVRDGTLLRMKDLLFHREPVQALRAQLCSFFERQPEINPTQWKELVGQSRKFTIPLAEYFDAQKLTLRVGDVRRLR